MGEVLFLDADSSLTYSFVIRKDGSYVVGNESDAFKNYFDRLYGIFDDQSEEVASYIEQMTAAMSEKQKIILLFSKAAVHVTICTAPLSLTVNGIW